MAGLRGKGWALLIAAAVVASGIAWYVAVQRDKATEATFATKPLFPGLSAKVNDVTALSLETAKGKFRIEKAGENWVIPEKGGYRAKADMVRKNIIGIAELETVEPRTDKPELYDFLQVGEPSAWKPTDEAAKSETGPIRAQLLDAKGSVLASVIIGKVKTRESGGKPAEIHARLDNEARAWLARGRVELQADATQWLDKETVKIERSRVAEAFIRHPNGERLHIIRKPDPENKDDFLPEPVPAGKKMGSQYDVNSVPGALSFFTFEDAARAASQDFSKATEVEIRTLDGIRATLRSVPAEDKKAWVTIQLAYDPALVKKDIKAEGLLDEAAAKKQAEEANARLEGWAYRVSEYAARDLTRRLGDLLEDDKPAEPEKK